MNLPNFITLFRIVLTPFFFTALVSYHEGAEEFYRWLALGLLIAATLTDAIDGFLARLWHQRTELGRFLDPFADKLLLVSGFLGLLYVSGLQYRPPLWITVVIVFRDLLLLSGMVLIYLVSGRLRVQPNFLGKCTTGVQMLTLIVILLEWPIAILFYYATAVLTILSLVVYTFREIKFFS